jgi:hypothetical protein
MAVSFVVQIVYHFLRRVIVFRVHRQPEPALFRPQNHRLAFHAAHHVERHTGLSSEGHFEEVLLNALFDGFLELALDLEVPVRGAEAPDPLVGPLVVVIFHPLPYPLDCVLEALELGPA